MWQYTYFIKAEDPEAYKKLAERGIMVGFPVKIKGQTHRSDINIPYHSTVKFFDPDKDKPAQVHAIANKLNFNPPDPKSTRIEPGKFKDRLGNDVFVIKIHGKHADEIKEHNKKFSHLGYPQKFEYTPHVSVDKKTWDGIVASKAKTAHEAGIEFGNAELKHGHRVLAAYRPKKAQEFGADAQPDSKLAESEDLEKSVFKNIGIAGLMGAALAGGSVSAHAPEQESPKYNRQHMLDSISQVESGGGKNVNHKPVNSGIHGSERAFGKFGLMPNDIRETVMMNPDLKHKYKKVTKLKGDDLHRYMQDNPGLEDKVAGKHVERLEHHFGYNPEKIGYAWFQGITGTKKAIKEGQDIGSHWHVKKIKSAYEKGNK